MTAPRVSVADAVATGTPEWLRSALTGIVDAKRVLTRPIDLVRFASDASAYRLMPRAVVLAAGVDEIQGLFATAHATGVPLTFRAAGTSLCGQGQGDGVLVDVQRHWQGVEVLDDGARVRVVPGTNAAHVNAALRPYGTALGPDPASIAACSVGGIVANNSSGMCCGVEENTYQTLESLTFVLPTGTVIDTAAGDAEQVFADNEPALAEGLAALRNELLGDPALAARVRAKYRMKNTTGYGLNALLDHESPLQAFAHLLVGSEGTLAFIAEVVLRTVPLQLHRVTGLLVLPDLHAASGAVARFRDAGARAVELMDRSSLRAVEDQPGVPPYLAGLPDGAAGLLVEFRSADSSELAALHQRATDTAAQLPVVVPAEFSTDPAQQQQYWTVRNGLFASVGAARPQGTSVILEDITVPTEHLADTAVDLSALFDRYGYAPGVVFGHAKDGNLHFLLTPRFDRAEETEHYARFMTDLVELIVVRYDGALKGEHGTGRNVAPFVAAEWGAAAYALMRRLKDLADPAGVLNPGVLLNDSPTAHVEHLKTSAVIDPVADRCIECGYCERVCPSRALTTTPRQRIVIERELARQRESGSATGLLTALEEHKAYASVDTCAGDGLCAIACPVDINTGEMVKNLRRERHSKGTDRVGRLVARHAAVAERGARGALRAGHLLARAGGDRTVAAMTAAARRVLGTENVPHWLPETPTAAPAALPETAREGATAVYFPACINRIFGAGGADPTLPRTFVAVAERAGQPLWIPPDVAGVCCATPWRSKGYQSGTVAMADRLAERIWGWTDAGRLPLVVDASSCTQGILDAAPYCSGANKERLADVTVLDSVQFVADRLLPELPVGRRVGSVALHPVCSVQHAGTAPALQASADHLAAEVVVAGGGGCCGMAGDRGFLHPELTESATAPVARELAAGPDHDDYLTSNRTCEIGLQHGTGRTYRSYLYLLERLSRR